METLHETKQPHRTGKPEPVTAISRAPDALGGQGVRWNDETVSRLVLGTAQLGSRYGIANVVGQPTTDEACDVVGKAWACGIRFFDTAQVYGDSERVVGEALRRLGVAGEARVITKLSPALDPLDGTCVREAAEASLRRLGVDRLWGLMLHRENRLDAWDHGLGETLRELRRRGRVRYLGVSVYTAGAAETALQHPDIDMVQVSCNAWDQRMLRAGIFGLARAVGKLCFVRSVFLQGLLSLSPETVATRLARALPAARVWWELVEAFGVAPVRLAMRFALSLGAPLVIGCESADQVTGNHALLGEPPLEDGARERIERALAPLLNEGILNPLRWEEEASDGAAMVVGSPPTRTSRTAVGRVQ